MKMRTTLIMLAAGMLAGTALPAVAQHDAVADSGQNVSIENYTPVTTEMLANPSASDWLMWRGTLNHQGYSPLDKINKENVGELNIAWARGLESGDMEATPLVHDGIMFMPQGRGVVQALNATNGDLIWEYRRSMPSDLAQYVQLNGITRNIALHENLVVMATPDSYMVALNAKTGAVEWETQISDYKTDPNWQTSGPIIANGKAISGRSCAPQGGPDACFIAAHDLSTGEEIWRTHTIPRPGEAGDETWGNIPYESRWHVGSWITPSYDPELNMIFAGTSVTSPYTKFIMGSEDPDAEHLYQTSTLALNADTGEMVWYQQHIRDQWDLDHPFERILVDTVIAPSADEVKWINPNVVPGEERKVLTGIPGKTGIFYSIDRATGEFLWARETTYQNVILDIDTSNGRATMNKDLFFTEAGQEHLVCPAAIGGKDWPAGAYSPLTNSIYYPLQNLCMNAMALGDEPVVEELGQVDLAATAAPGTDQLGTVRGINVETGKELWKYEQRANTLSLVATGGGLLFGGDMNRRFRAFDQETGDILWETILGGPVGGFPMTYEVDGRQYVAVASGGFLIAGSYLGLTPELRSNTSANQLFVFALPEKK